MTNKIEYQLLPRGWASVTQKQALKEWSDFAEAVAKTLGAELHGFNTKMFEL